MFNNLPKTLGKVLLVSILIGGVLLQANQISAQTDSGQTVSSTPSPTPQSTQYMYYFPVLVASPQVKLSSAWTADSNGNPKTTFVPGETIRFYTTGFNNSGSSASAGFTWFQEGPCGSSTLSVETINVSEEGWTKYKSSVVPDCLGIYTFTLYVSYEGQVSSYTAAYVVNNPSVVVNTTRQAFDRCNIPTTSQMQKWWTSSPYYGVNLYIGGISRGCANAGLNEFWVHIVSQQGWELIPTWVGPQAPCSIYKNRMSSNPTIAYQQGRGEASAAAEAAASLGFTKDRVIYYDLEGYAAATLSCRATVQSFLKGWTERLHELGVLSGVYGAAYSSYMNDWTSISPPPDFVWIASWYRSYYDPYATVWGIKYLSDSLWSYHQRLRQYAGDHVETWGGISFTIDSNVTDGAVMSLPLSSSSTQESEILSTDNLGPIAQPGQIRGMQQVSGDRGWVIKGGQLFWTEDGGFTWKDISPVDSQSMNLLTADFLNETHGWLVGQNQLTGEISVFRTVDGGGTWEPISISQRGEIFDHPIQTVYTSFIDSRTGWVALKHGSSSNFSLGSLYGTVDGGLTWSELTLPVGGPIYFKSPSDGWVAGGASGGELFVTTDGGKSWENQGLTLRPEGEDAEQFYGLPTFVDQQNGYLPLTVADPESPRVEVFASGDGGASWSLATAVPLDPANLPGSQVPATFGDQGQLFLAPNGQAEFYSLEPGLLDTLQPSEIGIPGQVMRVDFSQPASGWIQVQDGSCDGYKTRAGEPIPLGQVQFTCELRSLLYKTLDGGENWIEITP
jgi:photosystem II stability/assembly factor-like uncharacterized protein